jgi:hypothetical protein
MLDSDWSFLGFDVADGSLVSGLSNCGYTQADIEPLSRQWGPTLNEHHLFVGLDDASRFRDLADRRVTEHAPFFIFGLYVAQGRTELLDFGMGSGETA